MGSTSERDVIVEGVGADFNDVVLCTRDTSEREYGSHILSLHRDIVAVDTEEPVVRLVHIPIVAIGACSHRKERSRNERRGIESFYHSFHIQIRLIGFN